MSVEIHDVTSLYNGKMFDVFVEKVTLPNGVVKNREVVRHPGAAAMVPLLDDGNIVLIKQYRHAVGQYVWEIPAGTLEPEEDPLSLPTPEDIAPVFVYLASDESSSMTGLAYEARDYIEKSR